MRFVQYILNELNQLYSPMNSTLSDLEREMVDVFVRMAGVLNLPRSVGELYGVLFISPDPLCMNDCMDKLGISKGSTSQGLKILRSFGAVNTVYVPGDRRDYFEAESALRKIASGFVNEQVQPHLANGKERMGRLETLVQTADPDRREFYRDRVARLNGWHKHAKRLLPFAINLIRSD